MHNYKPNQFVRVLTVQIAVSAEENIDMVADEISAILSGALCAADTTLVDWQYKFPSGFSPFLEHFPVIRLGENPEEGDAFSMEEIQ